MVDMELNDQCENRTVPILLKVARKYVVVILKNIFTILYYLPVAPLSDRQINGPHQLKCLIRMVYMEGHSAAGISNLRQ